MRYANVNGERAFATPGLAGKCPACNNPVVPKCGPLRAHHWAHRGKRSCDSWWEPLTEWHRAWQDKFPEDWRERICHAESGEKHIADIQTPLGLTIEFQHSNINPEEQRSRELYYGNMVWVVNGARLKRDFSRFREGVSRLKAVAQSGPFITSSPDEVFPRTWLDCNTPVFFDFSDAEAMSDLDTQLASLLWCLLPGRVNGNAIIIAVAHANLVHRASAGPRLVLAERLKTVIEDYLKATAYAEAVRLHHLSRAPRHFLPQPHRRRRRL